MTTRRGGRRNTLTRCVPAALSAVISLSNCTWPAPAGVEPRKELLNELPRDLPQRAPHAATLLILPPDVRPAYATTRMAYMDRPLEIGYFDEYEWAEMPAQMLHESLQTMLQQAHYFEAVVTPPYTGAYRFTLQTELLELVQDFTVKPPVLRFSLRAQLTDETTRLTAGTADIRLCEPIGVRTPYGGVAAANSASAKALRTVAQLLAQAPDGSGTSMDQRSGCPASP